MKGSKQAGNEIERPIALANPIPNSSPSVRPPVHRSFTRSRNHVLDAVNLAKKKTKKTPISPFLITSGTRAIRGNRDTSRMLIIRKPRLGLTLSTNKFARVRSMRARSRSSDTLNIIVFPTWSGTHHTRKCGKAEYQRRED